jgi:chromosome transmission fidelity protein 18
MFGILHSLVCLALQMKEMIAHQVKLESFRQKDATSSNASDAQQAFFDVDLKTNSPAKEVPKPTVKAASSHKLGAKMLEDFAAAVPAPKRPRTSSSPSAAKNFLGIGAKKAKLAHSHRKAAAVGLGSKTNKMAHTCSGFRLNQAIRLRHVKGFTQAVRTPCRQHDLM